MSGSSSGGSSATALRAAASAGDVAACQRYLGSLRCVRFSRDEAGRSALHLAASAGHAAVIRLLLSVAAPREVDSPDGAGCTALQRAAADGHEEVLKVLIGRGADVNRQDAVHGNSALHEAAWKGYSRSVHILATAGAQLSQCNAGGFTALHLCCQNGHNQSCRELLLAGCDPDIQNNYGDTALHTAARYGHAGVTRILISAQCRVSEQNKNGDTALHIASAMGRRKLTRILLEAGCDKSVLNKQNETARDIAVRKELHEILSILDDGAIVRKEKKMKKKRSKSKVRFESSRGKDIVDSLKPKHWSPYGCHYYPDPEAFPSPRLDSLPHEPLKRGEQYYLDLAGNICKGPVGVGYTCYCAPLFRHLEARLERDKRELQRAQVRLGQRVAGLEQKLNRGVAGRRSERVMPTVSREINESTLPRSRSLEMLDKGQGRGGLQATRSMDELEGPEDQQEKDRPSVKELVGRFQQHQDQIPSTSGHNPGNNSESSDDEDMPPMRAAPISGPMGDSNLVESYVSNYENVPNIGPRSRTGVYSPMSSSSNLIDSNTRYIEPIIKIQESNARFNEQYKYLNHHHHSGGPSPRYQNAAFIDSTYKNVYNENHENPDVKYYEGINARLAKLRVLDSSKIYDKNLNLDSRIEGNFESTSRMLDHQDNVDRDTNNDSGYSTKVYGSSKGNSPSLSGQIDGELGAASLV